MATHGVFYKGTNYFFYMKQTDEARRIQVEIYQKMSFAQKMAEVQKMNTLGRQMKFAALKKQHPDWSDSKVSDKVKEVFLYART